MKLLHGDCLKLMKDFKVDMVLADPPYQITENSWDKMIPIQQMWQSIHRVLNPGGVVVLTSNQPFTSELVCSNLKWFRYEWVWVKPKGGGPFLAHKRPMRHHETILVFCEKTPKYNAQGLVKGGRSQNLGVGSSNYDSKGLGEYTAKWSNWPKDVLYYSHVHQAKHPTQKPLALMEYLIKTYSEEGDTVLDFCMGSGTTGVACKNTYRDFIGIEKDDEWFAKAKSRINNSNVLDSFMEEI